ncbi:hypothetical protein D3C72_1478920 [compost metagenome]
MGQVQIVLAFRHVVREFIADGVADPVGLAIVADHVQASDFRLFAAIEGKVRHAQRLAAGAHDGAVAFIEPFGLGAGRTVSRLAAFHAQAEHFHRIAQGLGIAADLLVHGVAGAGAAQVGQARARHVAVRFIGVVERRQHTSGSGHVRIGMRGIADRGVDQVRQADFLSDGVLRQCIRRVVAFDDADDVVLQQADEAAAVFIRKLQQQHGILRLM